MRASANLILGAVVASVLGTWSAGALSAGSVDSQSATDYQSYVAAYTPTVAAPDPLPYAKWVAAQVAASATTVAGLQLDLADAQAALVAAQAAYASGLQGCFTASGAAATCGSVGARTITQLEAGVTAAKATLDTAKSVLAAANATYTTALGALNTAYNVVQPSALLAGQSVDQFCTANPANASCVSFQTARTAANTAATGVTTATNGVNAATAAVTTAQGYVTNAQGVAGSAAVTAAGNTVKDVATSIANEQVLVLANQTNARILGEAGNPANSLLTTSANGGDVGQALVNGFDQLNTADKVEATTRAAADVALQKNIDAEAAIRDAADKRLDANITAETTARVAGDNALAKRIDATDARVGSLEGRVGVLERDVKAVRAGVAMSMALASIPTVNYGKFALGVGIGTFKSETAVAAALDVHTSERSKVRLGLSSAGGETGASAGFSVGF